MLECHPNFVISTQSGMNIFCSVVMLFFFVNVRPTATGGRLWKMNVFYFISIFDLMSLYCIYVLLCERLGIELIVLFEIRTIFWL